MGNLKDRTGDMHGSWTVLSHAGKNIKSGKVNHDWLCECSECGNKAVISSKHLYAPPNCECGANKKQRECKHGMSRSKIYHAWMAMIGRCEKPNATGYKFYGARGVKVCEEWHDFEVFYADMGDRPSDNHSLDRIDPKKGYSKENCRWATSHQQANNKRSSRFVSFGGETKTIAQWAALIGITRGGLRHRLRAGWSVENALTRPSDRKANIGSIREELLEAQADDDYAIRQG